MLCATVICVLLGLAVTTPATVSSNKEIEDHVRVIKSTKTGSPRKSDDSFIRSKSSPEDRAKYEEEIILESDFAKARNTYTRPHTRAVRETGNETIISNEGTAFLQDKTYDNVTVNNNGAVYNENAAYNHAKVINWGAVYYKGVVYNHSAVQNMGAVYNGPVTYNCSTATDDAGTAYNVAPVHKCDKK